MRVALLALAVGLVLADSSVVTLGLPDVLAEFDATPEAVSWVLTGYNLVLALVALPAALALRRARAELVLAVGLAVFVVASLACALADSLDMLVAARCVQGLGGAAIACAALPMLVDATGDRMHGTAIWAAAGAIGAAVGPAAGGALTDLLSWEAIFAVQVPLAVVCGLAAIPARRAGAAESLTTTDRPDWRSLAALFFMGAGLTAALFLPVLLLIAGWRYSPIAAAAAVSVMPVAALIAGVVGQRLSTRARGVAGAILCAGGLAALGLLPGSEIAWIVAPQILIGLGLGLALGALTEAALHDRRPLVFHGGWTLAARHAGVVAALAILTPIFTADLEAETDKAQVIVIARILDAPIDPATKLGLGLGLAEELNATEAEVPDVGPTFDEAAPQNEDRPAYDDLEVEVADQLDRAAASAFETSFIVSAILAALALVPLILPGGNGRGGGGRVGAAPAVAGLAAAGLIAAYLALGGGDYEVGEPPDPCTLSAPAERGGLTGVAERIGLNALAGTACELGISREELVLVLAGDRELPAGLTEEERDDAFREGLREAVDEEEEAGRIGSAEAFILRGAIEIAPVGALLERVFGEL